MERLFEREVVPSFVCEALEHERVEHIIEWNGTNRLLCREWCSFSG